MLEFFLVFGSFATFHIKRSEKISNFSLEYLKHFLEKQTNLVTLSLDFHSLTANPNFGTVTDNGIKLLCDAFGKLSTLNSLSLNMEK